MSAEFSFEGLGFDTVAAPGNPVMPNQVEGMSHWLCTFSKDGAAMHALISLSEEFDGRPPTLDEAIGFIQADISSINEFADFTDWLDDLGVASDGPEVEAYGHVHDAIRRIEAGFVEAFGHEWVDGLIGRGTYTPEVPSL